MQQTIVLNHHKILFILYDTSQKLWTQFMLHCSFNMADFTDILQGYIDIVKNMGK